MKKFLFTLLVFCTLLQADEQKRPTVCLNMIVKNETKVIKRCLESAKPLIDYWVIVDTGSTDGTQEMIKEFMKDIPGELHERPWVNFAHNRNEAFYLAKEKADYLLFIDADDIFGYSSEFSMPLLDQEAYLIQIKYNGMTYNRIQLAKSNLPWKWVGAVHEVLICNELKHPTTILDGLNMIIVGGGDRSHDPKKFLRDAALLEGALREDPTSSRNVFYLAQSYRDAEMPQEALKHYERRVEMGGWDQEVFWSLYQIAVLKENLNYPDEEIVKSYCKAYNFRPTRAEPLYRLAEFYRKKENYLLGYLTASFGLNIREPSDVLFVESWIYNYGLMLEHSISSYWLERYKESWGSCVQLLAKEDLPANIRECTEKNLRFVLPRLPVESVNEPILKTIEMIPRSTVTKSETLK